MEDFSQVFSAFSSWKVPLLHQPGKKFSFLVLFTSKNCNLAVFHSKQKTPTELCQLPQWLYNLEPIFYSLLWLSVSAVCKLFRPRIVYYFDDHTCQLSEKECKAICTNTDFWPSWKVWFPKWQTSLKKWKHTSSSLNTTNKNSTHTIFPKSTVTVSLAELTKTGFLWICYP